MLLSINLLIDTTSYIKSFSQVKFAGVVSELDSATKVINLISALIFCNKTEPALRHLLCPTAGKVSLEKFHAMIKFIIFIALSSYLTTQANFTIGSLLPICSTVPHIQQKVSFCNLHDIITSFYALSTTTSHIELPLFVFGTGARCRPPNTRRLRVEFPIPELGSNFVFGSM